MIDIGCGCGHRSAELMDNFQVTGVDFGENIKCAKEAYPDGTWLELNLNDPDPEMLNRIIDRNIENPSVVVSSDVIEHLPDPRSLLSLLKKLLETSPIAILSTPDRDGVYPGENNMGPPRNPAHVREWSLTEFSAMLRCDSGLELVQSGLTFNNDQDRNKATSIAVVRKKARRLVKLPSLLAILSTFNEADFVRESVKHLLDQGCTVHIIDNWSNDGTYEILEELQLAHPGSIVGE